MVPKDQKGEGFQRKNEAAFADPYNEALIHQVVTAYRNRGRSGTKANKGRGEVAGSTRKLWRQKGTGRARVGAASSPIRRSGGVTFAAKPRDFDSKVNRKMYRGAMRSILAQLIREDRLITVESFSLSSHKTKEMNQWFEVQGMEPKALLVDRSLSKELVLASRNIPNVMALEAQRVSPLDLIKAPKTIFTEEALAYFKESLR